MNINKVYKTTHSWGHPVAFNFQTSLQNKSSRWGNCKSSYPGFCYIKMCLKIECIPSYSLNVSAYFFFEIDDSPVVSENSAVPYLQAPANPSGGYFANDFARWFWQEWLRRLLLFWGESITRWRMMEGIYDSMMEYIILYHWNSLESFAKLMHVFHKMQLVEFTTKNGSCLAQIPKSTKSQANHETSNATEKHWPLAKPPVTGWARRETTTFYVELHPWEFSTIC